MKILWVTVAVVVVTLFNYKFLPYSVEIETKNNLKTSYMLNQQSIDLVKQKCMATGPDKKTTLLVLSNVVRENIEITEENRELYNLQIKITDICNFILNYLDLILHVGEDFELLFTISKENLEKLDVIAQMEEFMFLGLRKIEGVSKEIFKLYS